MPTPRIPVILLAGFLGAGKTSLLNHLMWQGGETRIGVVVNDFGRVNVDALAVAGQVDALVPIENGCLCCAADADEMDRMLERLTEPSLRIDVVVVEASGLAEPRTLIRTLLGSANERIWYGGLVEVVDAVEFDATRARHPELDRHVRAADLVVLNKTDRVGGPEAARLVAALHDLAPGTPVVATDHGRVAPELLIERRSRAEDRDGHRQLSFGDLRADEATACAADGRGERAADHAGHLHAAYQSVEFAAEWPLHPRRFLEFLDGRPGGLYRVKGQVRLASADGPRSFTVHAVGAYLRFQPLAVGHQQAPGTQLVLIGVGVDREAVTKQLTECVEPAPETVPAHHMLGVERYVRG